MAFLKFTMREEGISALKHALSVCEDPVSHAVAVQAAKDTNKYVPNRTGMLRNTTQVYGNMIVYNQGYAHFLYEGKVYIYPPTGSTFAPRGESKERTERDLHIWEGQSHWFEASKADNMEKWIKTAAEAILRGL